MAKSEHQGLQISLILFALLTVVLAITTFVYYSQSQEAAKKEEDSKKKMEAALAAVGDANTRSDFFLHILGRKPLPESEVIQLRSLLAADETMKGVIENFDKYIETFGAGVPKDRLNYDATAPQVLNAVRGHATALLQQTAETAKVSKDSELTRTEEAKRADIATKAQQEAEKKRDEEVSTYVADRKSLTDKQSEQLVNYTQEISNKKKLLDEAKVAEDKLAADVKKREVTISQQKDTIKEMRDEPFEVPDGQVTWVSQGANTVWVNLGLADGLRRQTMFSVFDQADNGVTRTASKASVEVTKVIDQHLSEARIISDKPGNPIMPGDQIFSPAWRPGKRVRFALTGTLDIDGDKRSDRNLVRSLLSASGGHIDEEMYDDGERVGAGMTSSTRYLVLGEPPDERSDPKILAAYSAMLKRAEELGVETIQLDTLLDWVGYKPEVRTRSVGLGKNADPNQFKPKPAEGKAPTSTGTVAEKFRERKPNDKDKSNKKSSAFDK